MSTQSDVIDVVSKGFDLVQRAISIIVPGSAPRRVQVNEEATLKEVLEEAGLPYSNKQTYSDRNGALLGPDSILGPGDTVAVISTQANG